mgnify:CR=1 FL=1
MTTHMKHISALIPTIKNEWKDVPDSLIYVYRTYFNVFLLENRCETTQILN